MLDSNHLISLPSDIGQLVRLERLSVRNNALVSLPVTISQLQKLSLLDVSSNNLAELTDAVADCLQLEELNVSNNKLQVDLCTCFQSLCCHSLNPTALVNIGYGDGACIRAVTYILKNPCLLALVV